MELDVEPVDDVDEAAVPVGIDAPEYVLYGGKGGVGKTTMAAATALASARGDVSTLVVSTDPAHSLSDTLDAEVPEQPAQIREDVPLYAAEIDPESALDDQPFGLDDSALSRVFGDGPDPLSGAMPGADEAAAVRLLIDYLDDPRFDRVVVDTAPTGHTLRLLELPEMLDSMVGKLLSLRQRMGGMFDGLFSDDDSEEEIDGLQAFSDRIERLRALLRDPDRTDFRVVLVPEELSVRESERLLGRLAEFEIPVETVVVNRVMQNPSEVANIDPDLFVSPNHTDCAFCKRRWQVQQQALAQSQDIFRSYTIRRVPLFAEEVRGERLLRTVAACLGES